MPLFQCSTHDLGNSDAKCFTSDFWLRCLLWSTCRAFVFCAHCDAYSLPPYRALLLVNSSAGIYTTALSFIQHPTHVEKLTRFLSLFCIYKSNLQSGDNTYFQKHIYDCPVIKRFECLQAQRVVLPCMYLCVYGSLSAFAPLMSASSSTQCVRCNREGICTKVLKTHVITCGRDTTA